VDTSPISPLLLVLLIGALAVVIAGAVAVGIRIAGGRPPARRGRGSHPEDAVAGYLQAQAQAIAARLDEFTNRIGELEAGRRAESAVLQTKVDDLAASSRAVADEARAVAGAMRDNQARGLWGEMQLERVLRMSGMDEHISYETQVSVAGPDGRSRPDAIVHLPSGRCVVIDAKTPLDSYLAGASTDDPDLRSQCFADHARAVGLHVRALAARNYDEVVPGAVDVVIVFLPSDALLAEAYRSQPELLDQALAARVVLASPSTLLAHLRGVALGWREQRLAEEAETIATLGRDLHHRFTTFAGHLNGVGTALGRAVDAYNKTVGSLERSVLPQARRFEELGAGSTRTITAVDPVEQQPRSLSA
jgi:DNA recombination protein RmuC